MNAASVTPPDALRARGADKDSGEGVDATLSTISDTLSLSEIVAQHLDETTDWSRALVERLRDAGYHPFDIGTAARFHEVTKVDLVRSFFGTTSEEMITAREGFDAFDPAAMQASDVGVLPVFPRLRPRVYGADDDIRSTANDAWESIGDANKPPQFFDLGGQAVWVKASAYAQADVEELTVPRMLHLLGEVVDWYKIVWEKARDMRPPKAVAEHLVATPHPRLPRLRRIVRCPVFDADGHLVLRPGYHEDSGLFYAPRNLRIPPVLSHPTQREIAHAKSLFVDELFGEFDFVSDADQTNAVALLLLPFIRDLIDGPTPLHVVTKPTPGSGGSLLVEAAFLPALGKEVPMSTLPTDEPEVQRRITAALKTSPTAIVFDNLNTKGTLDSGQVAAAITMTEWQDREIRTSKLLTLPVTNAWVATGNQVKVSDEIARRTVVIRLDPGCDNPFERTGWRHPNLLQWAKRHRPELIWAALTLVQAWVAEGKPSGGLTFGKFESWAETMSGICEVVDLRDLHANWREWREGQPSDVPVLRKVWAAWRAEFADQKIKAAKLLPVIGSIIDLNTHDEHSAVTELGTRLASWKGRVIDGYELVGNPASGSMSWRLVPRI